MRREIIGMLNRLLALSLLLLAGCGGNTYSVGGTITGLSGTVVLQNNSSNNLSVSANGAFTFAGYFTGGSAYNVTVLTQPAGQSCSVSAGSGSVNKTITTVVVTCTNTTLPRFAYVANASSNDISQYTIGTGGALTAMATATVPAGNAPNSIAVDRSVTYAYVANSVSDDIWQYAISQSAIGTVDGALTKLSITSLPTGSAPSFIAIYLAASGTTYAYVVNSGSDSVSQYTIGTSGVLDATSVKTVLAGKTPRSITIHPSGNNAYVVNSGSDDISQYSIGADGALTQLPSMSLPVGSAPTSITIATTPSGTYYAYVANSGSTSISQYAIVGGSLQSIPTIPPTVDVGATPYSVAVDAYGKYAYVANSGNGGSVSQYKITGGALIPMSAATVSAGTTPRSVTVDPSSQYVYTANYGSKNVSQYTIDTNNANTLGALTSNTTAATVAADVNPIFIITVH